MNKKKYKPQQTQCLPQPQWEHTQYAGWSDTGTQARVGKNVDMRCLNKHTTPGLLKDNHAHYSCNLIFFFIIDDMHYSNFAYTGIYKVSCMFY